MATARKFGPAEVAQTLGRQARERAASPAARIWLALGTVYLLWGSTYLGIKFAIDTIPPLLMGSLRFLVAGGVLYALAARGGGASRDRLSDPVGSGSPHRSGAAARWQWRGHPGGAVRAYRCGRAARRYGAVVDGDHRSGG